MILNTIYDKISRLLLLIQIQSMKPILNFFIYFKVKSKYAVHILIYPCEIAHSDIPIYQ